MRTVPEDLQAHLDGGVTTLCRCWRLITATGEAMGFTDHDRDLAFDGTVFEAEAGFAASEMESALGLAVDSLDAAGALQSDRLTAARLAAGDFDKAMVEIWLVNWQATAQRLLLRKGHLGEVSHGPLGFTAELRGLAHVLNQERGRIYRYGCDAVLGDARCGVDLSMAAYSVTATVSWAADRRRLCVSGAEGFAESWFARGSAVFATGANAGRLGEIKAHRITSGAVMIDLWQQMPFEIAAGDALTLRAGCDRQFPTCKAKFGNGLNFRGFPHIPGGDFALSYVTQGDPDNTGGSLQS
ncbi:MAG: DUF2163 domain-containing protein [Hyphomicrobiales bacterium]